MKKFTLNELTKKANDKLEELGLTTKDSRMSNLVTPRIIRTLSSENLISKPFPDGRNVYYTEQHYEEIILVRELQSKGLTGKSLLSLKTETMTNSQQSMTQECQSTKSPIRSVLSNESESSDLKNAADLNGLIKSMRVSGAATTFPSQLDDEKNTDDLMSKLSIYSSSSSSSLLDLGSSDFDKKLAVDSHSSQKLDDLLSLKKDKFQREGWEEYKLSETTILKIKSGSQLGDINELIKNLKELNEQIKKDI